MTNASLSAALGSPRLMLHLHAVSPIVVLKLEKGDALLVSTAKPGRMARVTFFDGDFMQVAQALERGQLANVGEPLDCDEVEHWVARALGESPAIPPTQAQRRA